MTRALDHRPPPLSSQEEPRGTVVGAADCTLVHHHQPPCWPLRAMWIAHFIHSALTSWWYFHPLKQRTLNCTIVTCMHCRNKPRLGGGFLYFQTLPIRRRANVLHLRFGLNNILLCVRHLITKFIYKVFWKINNIVIIGNN